MQEKINNLIKSANKQLKAKNIESSLIDSQILLAFTINMDRNFIICNPEFLIEKKQQEKFNQLLTRRLNFEPISHILGIREFYGYEFKVTSATLDPRADTETLIDIVKKQYKSNMAINFLDIGTGSAAIAITLLKEFQKAKATALDISKDALEIAAYNAKSLNVSERISFIESDLFTNIPNNHKFDLIISNPPYIKSADIDKLAPDIILYEPKIALDGGIDGLDFYRKIIKNAKNYLNNNGKILFEIGFDQNHAVEALLASEDFQNIQIFKDYGQNFRAIIANK